MAFFRVTISNATLINVLLAQARVHNPLIHGASMKSVKLACLTLTHAAAIGLGFGLGIYFLPILTAPPSPNAQTLSAVSSHAVYTGEFRRNLKGSDAFHWGEGTVSIGKDAISLSGKLSPGPDYKLYLSHQFVETEADFQRLKPSMVRVGDVRTFENFIVPIPPHVDPSQYTSIIIWCEAFGMFITAARYQ